MANRRTILWAEDDEDDVILIQRAFRFPLQIVRDGEEAILYLSGAGQFANREEFPMPDLVILDINMPKKSGFEVLDWLRKEAKLIFPVIMLSSSSQQPHINRAYELGANSYLVKASNWQDLAKRVEALQEYWLTINESLQQ
jgi:DNA-binding response OmpR family regulator